MKFHSILDVTEQMLDKARKAKWESLYAQEKERDGLIKKYFSQPFGYEKELSDAIRQVLDLDLEIKNQVLAERDQIGQDLKKLRQGKSGLQSYADVSLK